MLHWNAVRMRSYTLFFIVSVSISSLALAETNVTTPVGEATQILARINQARNAICRDVNSAAIHFPHIHSSEITKENISILQPDPVDPKDLIGKKNLAGYSQTCTGLDSIAHFYFDFDERVWEETKDLMDMDRTFFIDALQKLNVYIMPENDNPILFTKDLLAYLYIFFQDLKPKERIDLVADNRSSHKLVRWADDSGSKKIIVAQNAGVGLFNQQVRENTELVTANPDLLGPDGSARVQIAYNNILLAQLVKLQTPEKIVAFFKDNFELCIDINGDPGVNLASHGKPMRMALQELHRAVDVLLDFPYFTLQGAKLRTIHRADRFVNPLSFGVTLAYYTPPGFPSNDEYIGMLDPAYDDNFSGEVYGNFVLSHEVGHAVDYGLPDEVRQRYYDISWKDKDSQRAITPGLNGFNRDYAETSPREDLAEGVATYMYDPDLLSSVSSIKMGVLRDDIFGGVSYVGAAPDDMTLHLGGVEDNTPPYLDVHPRDALVLNVERSPIEPTKAAMTVRVNGAKDNGVGVAKIELWFQDEYKNTLPVFELTENHLTEEPGQYERKFHVDLARLHANRFIPTMRITDRIGKSVTYTADLAELIFPDDIFRDIERPQMDLTPPVLSMAPDEAVQFNYEGDPQNGLLKITVNGVSDDSGKISHIVLNPSTVYENVRWRNSPITIPASAFDSATNAYSVRERLDLSQFFAADYEFAIDIYDQAGNKVTYSQDLPEIAIPGRRPFPDRQGPTLAALPKDSLTLDLRNFNEADETFELGIDLKGATDPSGIKLAIITPITEHKGEAIRGRSISLGSGLESKSEPGRFKGLVQLPREDFYPGVAKFEIELIDTVGNKRVYGEDLLEFEIPGTRTDQDITAPRLLSDPRNALQLSLTVNDDGQSAKIMARLHGILEEESDLTQVEIVPVANVGGRIHRGSILNLTQAARDPNYSGAGIGLIAQFTVPLKDFYDADYYFQINLRDSAGLEAKYNRGLAGVRIPGLLSEPLSGGEQVGSNPSSEPSTKIPNVGAKSEDELRKKAEAIDFVIDWTQASAIPVESEYKNETWADVLLPISPSDQFSKLKLIWRGNETGLEADYSVEANSAELQQVERDGVLQTVVRTVFPYNMPSDKYELHKVLLDEQERISPIPSPVVVEHESDFDISSPWDVGDGTRMRLDSASGEIVVEVPLTGIESPGGAKGSMTIRYPDGSVATRELQIIDGGDSVRGVARFPNPGMRGSTHLQKLEIEEGWFASPGVGVSGGVATPGREREGKRLPGATAGPKATVKDPLGRDVVSPAHPQFRRPPVHDKRAFERRERVRDVEIKPKDRLY